MMATMRQVDGRCDALDEKIKKLDGELIKYRQQMQRMRPGPAQNGVKQRALKIMRQKKLCGFLGEPPSQVML